MFGLYIGSKSHKLDLISIENKSTDNHRTYLDWLINTSFINFIKIILSQKTLSTLNIKMKYNLVSLK